MCVCENVQYMCNICVAAEYVAVSSNIYIKMSRIIKSKVAHHINLRKAFVSYLAEMDIIVQALCI